MSWLIDKSFRPMLIGAQQPAFDDENYLYEIKQDGIRCVAYLTKQETYLQNKRGLCLNSYFPEMLMLHRRVMEPCILDGELYVFSNGKSDFFKIQKRALTKNLFKTQRLSAQFPATFTAFDIVWKKDKALIDQPLHRRKQILESSIQEDSHINYSRSIEQNGCELFALAKEKGLEGIVAKKKNSLYYPEKRTKDWIKCKNLLDEDYVITGYIPKSKGICSLILAIYTPNELIYKGHVTMGVSLPYLFQHTKKSDICPFAQLPNGNEDAIWIYPFLVGMVQFMEYTANGGLRQPVFKGFREDKAPADCIQR